MVQSDAKLKTKLLALAESGAKRPGPNSEFGLAVKRFTTPTSDHPKVAFVTFLGPDRDSVEHITLTIQRGNKVIFAKAWGTKGLSSRGIESEWKEIMTHVSRHEIRDYVVDDNASRPMFDVDGKVIVPTFPLKD